MSIEKLRQVFALESEDTLQQMEDSLLNLEQQPQDQEAINVLFRATHTLKGSAGVVGLDDVSSFTHKVENVLQKVRSGEWTLNPEAIRALLSSRDHIAGLINFAIENPDATIDNDLVATGERLNQELTQCFTAPAASPPQPKKTPEAVAVKKNEPLSSSARLQQIFIQEMSQTVQQMHAAAEHLQTMGTSANEAQVRVELEILARAAHTLKGSAGLIGIDAISNFSGVLESVFKDCQQKNAISPGLLAVAIPCAEHLQAMGEAFAATDVQGLSALEAQSSHFIKLLEQARAGGADYMPAEVTQPVTVLNAETAVMDEDWHISLRFTEDALRNGIDPIASIRYLADQGEIVTLSTLFDTMPSALGMDPETCYLGFEIEFRSAIHDKENIEAMFDLIKEHCHIHILPPHSHLSEYITLIHGLPEDTMRLGEILLEIGTLTERELEEGLALQQLPDGDYPALVNEASEDAHKKLGEILVGSGMVQQDVVNAALHKQQQVRESRSRRQKMLQVDALKLDQLINLVGELVIANAGLSLQMQNDKLNPARLKEAASLMSRLVEEIRNRTLSMRMVPIGGTFSRFRRLVHDLSYDLNKKIELIISGAETELDKTMIEKINDPLMHLVRNAIDHGVEPAEQRLAHGKPEQGIVHLNAYHDSGSIVIEIMDDGAGIDKDKILAKAIAQGLVQDNDRLSDDEIYQLIFEPGLSTAAEITELSGRGVGLDVVKRNITALNGLINVDSELGEGSTFQIYLPLTLAIIDGFLLTVGGLSFVIPLDRIIECVEYSTVQEEMDQSGYFNLRGKVLPLLDVHTLFELPEPENAARNNIIVVHYGNQEAGLIVDQLLGEFQAVIKPLGKVFESLAGFSGATILGSGEVALILDVPALIQRHINKER